MKINVVSFCDSSRGNTFQAMRTKTFANTCFFHSVSWSQIIQTVFRRQTIIPACPLVQSNNKFLNFIPSNVYQRYIVAFDRRWIQPHPHYRLPLRLRHLFWLIIFPADSYSKSGAKEQIFSISFNPSGRVDTLCNCSIPSLFSVKR